MRLNSKLYITNCINTAVQVEDKLVLETTADWLTAPSHLILPFNGRDFEIAIDPTTLSPGLHYAEVRAFDSTALWRGPLARIPVTICKPHIVGADPAMASGTCAPLPPIAALLSGRKRAGNRVGSKGGIIVHGLKYKDYSGRITVEGL